ncbi:MAG: hypothetical protein JNL83_39745 [Myxococcales bacterium]|nr:hypothetical protein [Myxococcales bacterium]
MRIAALVMVMVMCGTAGAEEDGTPALGGEGVLYEGSNPPRFAFMGPKAHVSPKTLKAVLDVEYPAYSLSDEVTARQVEAMSTDKNAYWITADLTEFVIGCGMEPCPPPPPPPPARAHASFLWRRVSKDWELVAFAVAPTYPGKAQAAGIKQGLMPEAIAKRVDAGAEDAVKLFETTIGDPKAFAATVSTRKDVVLFGNEPAERTVGGAKVKAKLEAWKLAFKVRDGIQAGPAGKGVVWIAANVDSTSTKKPKDKPVPYRLFAIYEKTGADWKLVHANFAYIGPAPKE